MGAGPGLARITYDIYVGVQSGVHLCAVGALRIRCFQALSSSGRLHAAVGPWSTHRLHTCIPREHALYSDLAQSLEILVHLPPSLSLQLFCPSHALRTHLQCTNYARVLVHALYPVHISAHWPVKRSFGDAPTQTRAWCSCMLRVF